MEQTTRIVVLLDGDNTTWSANAAIIDVPDSVYNVDVLAGDSKLLRNYIDGAPTAIGAVAVLELIAEVIYADDYPDGEWSADDFHKIDSYLKDYGFGPKGKAGG